MLPDRLRQFNFGDEVLRQYERIVRDTYNRLVDNVLTRGLLFAEHFRGQIFTVNVTVPSDVVSIPTLLNGWAEYSPPSWPVQVRKGPDGRVSVTGMVVPGTVGFGPPVPYIFHWPPGYAPRKLEIFNALPNAVGRAETYVDVTGIFIGSMSGGITWVSLSGVIFDAADRSPVPWSTISQPQLVLEPTFPGDPAQVLVLDAVSSNNDHTGPLQATWSVGVVGQRRVIRLLHVAGLAPSTTYTLTIMVFSA